jgi:hypothetical protein
MQELLKNLVFKIAFFVVFVVQVQAQEAQQPSIMVIPSDNLLLRLGCLTEENQQGKKVYIRDYQKAFVEDDRLKFIISAIDERFAARGFPLEHLEQTLKQLQNETAADATENFDTDAKTRILKVARPDIILDLTYNFTEMGMTNKLTFIMEALDAYTLKSVASAQHAGVQTTSRDVEKLMAEQVENNINNLQDLMGQHFDDLRKNGREITLRIVIENQAVDDFRRDRCGDSLPYAMWVQKWVRANAVNGVQKRSMATAKELRFSSIRIPLFDEEGYPVSASDWSFKLTEALVEDCNIIAIDYTQGLGDAFVVITN